MSRSSRFVGGPNAMANLKANCSGYSVGDFLFHLGFLAVIVALIAGIGWKTSWARPVGITGVVFLLALFVEAFVARKRRAQKMRSK